MNHGITHISIPQPCAQNWADMDVVEQGRYCQSCQKTVTDLSKMTNEEIVALLSVAGNTCGRLNANQLQDLNATLAINQLSRFSWKKFSLAATFIGLVPFVKAEAKTKSQVESRPIMFKRSVNQIDTEKTYRVVTGTIISDDDKSPLLGATIKVKGTDIATYADVNGRYKITVPLIKDTLTISYIGYVAKDIKIDRHNTTEVETILSLNEPIALHMALVGGVFIRRSFAWRAWHTITWPVRAVFSSR